MNDSILLTIKQLLGPDSSYEVFDPDIIVFINSALATLRQLGIGPANGFRITGPEEKWSDFVGDRVDLESVKEYVYLKVRMAFDPPASSFVLTAFQETCAELEWRLNITVDDHDPTKKALTE